MCVLGGKSTLIKFGKMSKEKHFWPAISPLLCCLKPEEVKIKTNNENGSMCPVWSIGGKEVSLSSHKIAAPLPFLCQTGENIPALLFTIMPDMCLCYLSSDTGNTRKKTQLGDSQMWMCCS